MYITEQEIMEQHIALAKTYEYMMAQKSSIQKFFEAEGKTRFVILGSGSSYMLAKSLQRLLAACPDTAAAAISGGDFLLNPEYYKETVKNSIVITLSRSGQTSEILQGIRYCKQYHRVPIISLTMKEDNDFMPFTDLDITMPWCYDNSVCQTRTVTNLYAACLLLASFYGKDDELAIAVHQAVEVNDAFKQTYRPLLTEVTKQPWENATILADGALSGIAEEGALAFTEICMLSGQQFNLLDYRHGPIVIQDEKTLTVAVITDKNSKLQENMVRDLKEHKGTLVTVTNQAETSYEAALNVNVGAISRVEAWGIPLIFVCQILAYEKAMLRGTNPDEPTGLNAFITLSEEEA